MKDIPENEIGLKKFAYWCDHGKTLHEQLEEAGIEFQVVEIPHLVGVGGNGYLTFYQSPQTGKPMTVLCIPIRYDIDGFAEEYYYFEMTPEEALKDERWWLDAYDICKQLTRCSL